MNESNKSKVFDPNSGMVEANQPHVMELFVKEMHQLMSVLDEAEDKLSSIAVRVAGAKPQNISAEPANEAGDGYQYQLTALRGRLSGIADRITKHSYEISEFI